MRFLILSLALSLSLATQAFELPSFFKGNILSKIGVAKSRVKDKASILAWDYRLKLNHYLESVNKEVDIDWEIIILNSLEGKSIEEVALGNISTRDANAALFILSLSDRKFKLTFSETLNNQLGVETTNKLVSLIIPSLVKNDHQQAIYNLLEASSFAKNPSFKLSPPLAGLRKHRSFKGFTYFIAAFFFVFLMGHKVFSSPKIKRIVTNEEASDSTTTQGLFHHSFFLKRGLKLNPNDIHSYNERLMKLKQRDVSFNFYKTNASDLYPASHFRSALALSIFCLTLLYFFPLEWRDPIYILAVFAQALIIGYLLAFFSRIKRFFTTKKEMKEETYQLLIETITTDYSSLQTSSVNIGYSELENKIDFIFSNKLLDMFKKEDSAITPHKLLNQFFKQKVSLLRSGEFDNFFGSLISLLEIQTEEDFFEHREITSISEPGPAKISEPEQPQENEENKETQEESKAQEHDRP